ncbi:ATP-binding protein [Streptomyces sp. NPDC090135]|uniref:ATP-binding protein n=1 Tax=Streptomyces sp. NPDC090135 TaxID=3365957 RepID=UPI0037FBFDBB
MNLDRKLLLLDSRRIDGLGSILDAPQHQKCLTLTADDRAPGTARSFTREALTAWGVEDLLDHVELIVSELATNAERHGRRVVHRGGSERAKQDPHRDEITLRLALQDGVVGIEVEDNSPEPPVPRIASPYATGGHGLLLVSAMADAWTACPKKDGSGKRVIAFVKRPETSLTP